MAVRERASFLAAKDCKIIDDKFIQFGTRNGKSDTNTYDRRLGYSSASGSTGLVLQSARASATSPAYEYGLLVESSLLFVGTGAGVKQFGLYLTGSRPSTSVMGGDSHDMQLKADYTNEAVNTPAGSYARGLSCQMNNKGAISSLQGGFLGVRQRSTGACSQLLGLQVDAKVDVGKLAPATELSGIRVELDLGDSVACAASYGVVVRNRTDGANTPPTAAFKAYNDGTTSCKGFTYGVDLYGTAARTALADIRLCSADSDALAGLILSGAGTDDATIKTDLTARGISAAHGSLYLSIVKGAGSAWSNKNGTWTVCV